MSNGQQNVVRILPEYSVDNLGTSFKVILVNSAERIQGENGYEIYIPNYQELIKRVALSIAVHPIKLKSGDIRFLRKTLGLKGKELAEKLDISPEHLSRCEAGDKTLSLNSEKVLRTLVLLEAVYVLQKAVEDSIEDPSGVLDKISKLLVKLKDVISGLKISPVHQVEDEQVLCFKLESREAPGMLPANDLVGRPPSEWLDQAA